MFASAMTQPELLGRVLYCKSAFTGTRNMPPKIPMAAYRIESATGWTMNGIRNMQMEAPTMPSGTKPVSIKSREL